MAPRITGTTDSCKNCPYYRYYSGGQYECTKVEENLLDPERVAPFCPLPEYPSRNIAELQTTVHVLRKGSEFPFELVLLSHVAAKLGVPLTASARGLTMPIEKDQELYLGYDYIKEIKLQPFTITFMGKDGLYKLAPDSKSLRLMKAKDETGDLWCEVEIRSSARPA